jgi:hypothetical protein
MVLVLGFRSQQKTIAEPELSEVNIAQFEAFRNPA